MCTNPESLTSDATHCPFIKRQIHLKDITLLQNERLRDYALNLAGQRLAWALAAVDGRASPELKRKRNTSLEIVRGKRLLEHIGVERIAVPNSTEITRLRKCANGTTVDKKPHPKRSTQLPVNLAQQFADGDLVLLHCKRNNESAGGNAHIDFESLRMIAYLKSAQWRKAFNDGDVYEYKLAKINRYLLSRCAFEALVKEAQQVRADPVFVDPVHACLRSVHTGIPHPAPQTKFEAIQEMRGKSKDNVRKAVALLFGIRRDDGVSDELCDSFRKTVDAMTTAIEPDANSDGGCQIKDDIATAVLGLARLGKRPFHTGSLASR